MIETKEVLLNSKKFLVTQFMAREGLKLQFRLVKQLGPMMGSIASDLLLDGKIDAVVIAKALSQRIDEDACFSLVMDLLKNVKFKNQDLREIDFDVVFAGDYKTLYELLYFIIDLNYGNFFGVGGIGNLLNKEPSTKEDESFVKTT